MCVVCCLLFVGRWLSVVGWCMLMFVVRCLLSVVCVVLLVVRRLLFVVWYWMSAYCCLLRAGVLLVVCGLTFAVCCLLCVV